MQSVSVSVVVPTYCNAGSLRELHQRLSESLQNGYPDFELMLVDDGSPDNTWQVITELAAKDARVKGIRLSRNFGQHPAIAAAFDRVRGNKIVLMDGDLEDRPENIPELLAHLTDVDVVYTLKLGERGNFLTRVTSFSFHQVFSRIARVDIPGEVGTLRAFNRKVLEAIRCHREYNVLFGPLMFFIGFPSKFVTVERDARRHGRSSYTFLKRLSLAGRALASYTNLPHQLFFVVGAIVLGATAIYFTVTLIQTLVMGAQLPPGLTLLALLLLFFMGMTMVSLGVIGSYVFRVYQEVLGRPRYVVSDETRSV
jgi:glycosyltransferase involved in cell wall biosynthesis